MSDVYLVDGEVMGDDSWEKLATDLLHDREAILRYAQGSYEDGETQDIEWLRIRAAELKRATKG